VDFRLAEGGTVHRGVHLVVMASIREGDELGLVVGESRR
jgi:hypothetical protein